MFELQQVDSIGVYELQKFSSVRFRCTVDRLICVVRIGPLPAALILTNEHRSNIVQNLCFFIIPTIIDCTGPVYSDEQASIQTRGEIGLIIDDFGYRNDDISDGFLHLDVKLTCAVIPGHAYSSSFGEKAVSRGHEVIVHMPMENMGENRGEEEFVLRVGMTLDSIKNRVHKALDQIP